MTLYPIFHSTGVWKPRPRKGYILAILWINGDILWSKHSTEVAKKVFKITLYHYNMQKLFIFPTILLFHPNNEERQDLNIEQRKLNENNRNGKQKHWKGLNLTITSNTSMMTSIIGKTYQISYRCGVINDCINSSPEPLSPFSRFGYFRLVYIDSIFRFCRSSLFGSKED